MNTGNITLNVEQRSRYYPSGLPLNTTGKEDVTDRLYIGNAWLNLDGLGYYNNTARMHDAVCQRFSSPDSESHSFTWLSQYAHTAGNPVNLYDPSGRVTYVVPQSDGTFKVVGGYIADVNDSGMSENNAIIVGSMENGIFVGDEVIGYTTSVTSFYDTDSKNWVEDAVIDLGDLSGISFLDEIANNTPDLITYANNAQNGKIYDFKVTNNDKSKIGGKNSLKDKYRGMRIGGEYKGNPLITSARDVGNIAAGYVAAVKGLNWISVRYFFDSYESYGSPWLVFIPPYKGEGPATVNAQLYGFAKGRAAISQQIILNMIREPY